jgi:hypothetical protein
MSGVVAYTCNPNIWEAEAGGSQVQTSYTVRLFLKKRLHTKKLHNVYTQ